MVNVIEVERIAPRAATVLKAMSNPHRLMILAYLEHGELNVGELERAIGLSQSALSQHLARLRRDDLVKTRRLAQTIYYSLNGRESHTVLAALLDLYREAGGGPFLAADHRTTKAAAAS